MVGFIHQPQYILGKSCWHPQNRRLLCEQINCMKSKIYFSNVKKIHFLTHSKYVQSPLQRTSGYCCLDEYWLFTAYITHQLTMLENYRAFKGEAGCTNSYYCILKVKHYWENRGWCSSWRDNGWVQWEQKKPVRRTRGNWIQLLLFSSNFQN